MAATTMSRKIKISLGTRSQEELNLTYTCFAALSGAETIVSEIENQLEEHHHSWITRGAGFILELHISWTNETEHTYQTKLLLKLIEALRNTRIWDDLCLVPLVRRSAHSSIELTLQHDEAALATKDTTGRSAAGYSSTLRPPRGLSIVTLEKIELNLAFTKYLLPKLQKKSSDQHHRTVQTLQATQTDINFISLEDEAFEDIPAFYNGQSPTDSPDGEMAWSQAASSWQEQNHPRLGDEPGPSISDLDSALQLIDSVLRIYILGARTSGRTRPMRTGNTTTLAKLCPVMFCPGYLKAMNERVSLIPSMVHSITGIARRSHSESLSAKSVEALEADMWKLASTQLYNTKASFKLSPLMIISQQNETETLLNSAIRHSAVSVDMIDPFDEFHDIQDISDRSDEKEVEEDVDYFEDLLESDLYLGDGGIDFSALDADNDDVDDAYYSFGQDKIDLPEHNGCSIMSMDQGDRQLSLLAMNDIFSDL